METLNDLQIKLFNTDKEILSIKIDMSLAVIRREIEELEALRIELKKPYKNE